MNSGNTTSNIYNVIAIGWFSTHAYRLFFNLFEIWSLKF